MITFEIGGRRVKPENIADALEAAILEAIAGQIREKIGSIRDPQTGEFPTIVMRGESLDDLSMHVEGSPALIEAVRARMEDDEMLEEQIDTGDTAVPRVFLSYTHENMALARDVAQTLQSNGVDTWWDQWCINAGDSLRQKIDEGLGECTHFLVLLTPESIKKPWVNQEMDAGLVRRLNSKCRFLPIRYQLPASELPPLLSGMLAPEIGSDGDISQLIADIHGLTRKPAMGPKPESATLSDETETGYSLAANAVAKLFVQQSKHGRFADPQIGAEDIAEQTGLSLEDTQDALFELSTFIKDTIIHVMVKGALFAEFDRYWMDWDTRDDALRLAADIMNDEGFPSDCGEIAERYGWDARRLNPVATYLHERDLIMDYKVMGNGNFDMMRIVGKEGPLRRFVKSRRQQA
ncbi:MAG: toll/interleukin-1 receptor domain-containing protein [Boseongicola sp.]|nr:toll/interleukin-1 receptor domain-containing protein [Silicimonas sp.]NNL17382.1 toll/interleukin-1 receptor domain-containing protein [Boseongicola sp.]